ncbi:TonB-dependent receptor [Alteromonas pelagimontana]|uniref:TonB-dependent receptor n=2 Tax=Alteromonas pelagimontana TaxID=1858656 RepID=A0A6M4MIB0_9ALTE|nr:TonB-dependent receptor [Alteromonas pelagimontana]
MLAIATATAGAYGQEQAEDESEQVERAPAQTEVIEVRGYRGSLFNSSAAKRESQGFVDEVFADDIGKMPSQNLAESLSRIPGVKINRDVTGEGQQISVRGLGPSFTKIALNGNSIAIASDGSLGSGNRNREVDLDIFPTELFSSLAVSKTATASQLEGGVSGFVNMRTARPFDAGEDGFKYSLEGAYGDLREEINPRYSFMYKKTGEEFGVLIGVAGANTKSRVDGYEAVSLFTDGCTAQWDNPEHSASSCVDGSQGLNHFFWSPEATADYAAAHPGVNVGDAVDPVATSGLDAETLDTALLPYLGRPMFTYGDRDRVSGLVSFQYRPGDNLDMALDIMYADASKDFVRTEAMWWGRRNYLHQGAAIIPEDVTVDSNGYVQSGTFYNSHIWVGSHDYQEDLSFLSVMPNVEWQATSLLNVKASASFTKSEFDRDEPYALYMSPSGTMTFENGEVPSFNFSEDPASPDIGWTWQQEYDQNGDGEIAADEKFGDMFRIQRNHRETETKGLHLDFEYGEAPDYNGFKFGIAWDENSSNMRSFGGTAEFTENNVIGSDAYNNFADYLGPSLVNDLGNSISGYSGYTGIAQIDWARLKEATDYNNFDAIEQAGDQFGQTVGDITEEVLGLYLEANAETEIADRNLRMNMGVRWVSTDQNVATTESETNASYDKLLPSFSVVYDVAEDVKLRASASRSLTRANPSDMFPNASWGGSGIESVNAGNPYLSPFEATNFDIGGEWYFSDLGYVGLTYFEKEVTGFTRSDSVTVPFTELPTYGMDITSIGADREQALLECGGPSQCTTVVNTRNNIDGSTTLSGFEAVWVMPLDFIVEGMGFNASATTIKQDASDEEAIITGISEWSYNATAFYENEAFQTRLTLYHQDGAASYYSQGKEVFSFDRTQVDLSASYQLPVSYDMTVTFDAYNLTNEPVGNWHEYSGIAFDAFYPGTTYTLGLRGAF